MQGIGNLIFICVVWFTGYFYCASYSQYIPYTEYYIMTCNGRRESEKNAIMMYQSHS